MKQLKSEFAPILLLLGALIVFGTISILGMIYNLVKSFYECFQVKFWKGVIKFILYWLNVLYQTWNAIKGLLVDEGLAIFLDIFANATGGEMCEDCCTTRENTWFNKGNITLSASIGKEEFEGFLVKFGWRVTKLLNILGKNHSIDAYKKELYKMEVKKNN